MEQQFSMSPDLATVSRNIPPDGRRSLLQKALEVVNARERHILTERRLKYRPYPYVIISEFAKITFMEQCRPDNAVINAAA